MVAARSNQQVEGGESLPEFLLKAVGDVGHVNHRAVAVDQERGHTLVVDVAAEEDEQDVAGEGERAQAKETGRDRRTGAGADDGADAAQALVDVPHLDVVGAAGDLHGRLQLSPVLVLLALRLAVFHVVVVPAEQVHCYAAHDVHTRRHQDAELDERDVVKLSADADHVVAHLGPKERWPDDNAGDVKRRERAEGDHRVLLRGSEEVDALHQVGVCGSGGGQGGRDAGHGHLHRLRGNFVQLRHVPFRLGGGGEYGAQLCHPSYPFSVPPTAVCCICDSPAFSLWLQPVQSRQELS